MMNYLKLQVVRLSILREKLYSLLTLKGLQDIKDTTKVNFRRILENRCSLLRFVKTSTNKILVYSSQLSVAQLVEENDRLKAELMANKPSCNNIEAGATALHNILKNYEDNYEPQWPPNPNVVDKHHVNIPNEVQEFLQVIFTGGKLATISRRVHMLISSIGQDMLYAISRGKIQTPKHILLTSTVKSLTGNVELISILNKFGHGISYSKYEEIETALCLQKLALLPEGNVPLPENILAGVSTTLAFDNIDRVEETLSGSGTSHRINGIAVQPKIQGPQLQKPMPNIAQKKQRTLGHMIDYFAIPNYNAGEKAGPPRRMAITEIDFSAIKEAAWKKDLIWFLCRLHHTANQQIPSWTGFNILVSNQEATTDTVGYLPTINAPASNMSTVNEILSQCVKIKQQLHLDAVNCVFDQALYAKAADIRWKHPDNFNNVILCLGTFHTICNLLGVIGKRFQDAGLHDVAIETS